MHSLVLVITLATTACGAATEGSCPAGSGACQEAGDEFSTIHTRALKLVAKSSKAKKCVPCSYEPGAAPCCNPYTTPSQYCPKGNKCCDCGSTACSCEEVEDCDKSGCQGCQGEQCTICYAEKEVECCLDDTCHGCQGEQCSLCRQDNLATCCSGAPGTVSMCTTTTTTTTTAMTTTTTTTTSACENDCQGCFGHACTICYAVREVECCLEGICHECQGDQCTLCRQANLATCCTDALPIISMCTPQCAVCSTAPGAPPCCDPDSTPTQYCPDGHPCCDCGSSSCSCRSSA